MLRLFKLASLSALILASTASAQTPVPLVYSKAGYAPVAAPNVVAYSMNGQTHYMPAAAPVAPGGYTKTARIPVYAPGPVSYQPQPIYQPAMAPTVTQYQTHHQVMAAPTHYRRQQVVNAPLPYQPPIVATERPVVYEAAVLPVVKNGETLRTDASQRHYIQGQPVYQSGTGYPAQ